MKIRKCIIPIAGKGTRFLPITKTVSKEMLPIVNEPTILLLVKECYKSGIEEIIFVVGEHNHDLVKSFFSPNSELENFLGNDMKKKELLNDVNEIISKIKFHYVFQDENVRGTAGAIYAAKDYIKDEYFGIMFGDDIIDSEVPALQQLIDEHELHNCNVVGVGEVPMELVPNYGIIKYKEDNIIETIIEKPRLEEAPSNHAIQGRMLVNSTIFDKILKGKKHDNNEYYLAEIIMDLDEEVRAIKMNGTYYDIGSHAGYIKANLVYGLKKENIKKDLLEYIKNIGE